MLSRPSLPEAQKSEIRKALVKLQEYDEMMMSKTRFSSSAEWHAHFKYVWAKNKDEMKSSISVQRKEYTKAREESYERWKNKEKEINKSFRARLLGSKRFLEKVKKISNFENPSTPQHWIYEKIFLEHVMAKLAEANEKKAKDSGDAGKIALAKQMTLIPGRAQAISSEDITFVLKEVRDYFKENEAAYVRHLNTSRAARRLGVDNFIKFVKEMKRLTAPKRDSKRFENYNRDYHMAIGQIDGIYFSQPLAHKNFKVFDVVALKKFKREANANIREFNKLIKLARATLDLDYVNKNRGALLETVRSYQRERLDRKVGDFLSKNSVDDSSGYDDRKESKELIKKWTNKFVIQSKVKKLKERELYLKNEYWYGALVKM